MFDLEGQNQLVQVKSGQNWAQNGQSHLIHPKKPNKAFIPLILNPQVRACNRILKIFNLEGQNQLIQAKSGQNWAQIGQNDLIHPIELSKNFFLVVYMLVDP